MSLLTEIRQLSQTAKEQIREMLWNRIISGDPEPGAKVTQAIPSRRLAVIRGSLREAIIRFTEEGFWSRRIVADCAFAWSGKGYVRNSIPIRTTLERLNFEQAREQREDEATPLLKNRYQRLEAASERRDLAASVEGEASFHSSVYRLSRHGPLRAHWNRLVRSVQICVPLHQKEHKAEGVFMFANAECLKLVSGIELGAVPYHICHYIQRGLREVSVCIPKDEAT